VLIAQGKTIAETCKQLGITDQTYYRWRKEYGGMKIDQAKRLKEKIGRGEFQY
jgi:transposase-like protein